MGPIVGNDAVRSSRYGSVELHSRVTFGASGAVSSQTSSDSSGFTVTKPSGTGLYRITTDHEYSQFLSLHVVAYNQGTSKSYTFEIDSEYASKVLDFQVVDSGTDANMASGDKLFITAKFANKDVNPAL